MNPQGSLTTEVNILTFILPKWKTFYASFFLLIGTCRCTFDKLLGTICMVRTLSP